jgi:hypothetical protein
VRKEVRELRMERDILKRVAAIFAKESHVRFAFIDAEKAVQTGQAHELLRAL